MIAEYPRLIEGVSITPFDSSSTEPLYLVHLPGGKKLQVSQDLYAVLCLLDGRNSVEALAEHLSTRLGRRVGEQEIDWIIREKLAPTGIIAGQGDLSGQAQAGGTNKGALSLLLKIPLLSEKQLRPLTSIGQYLFAKPALIFFLVVGGLVHIPVYLQLQVLTSSLNLNTLYSSGSLVILLLAALSGMLHELGHLSACHRYGARYGKLGFGIYITSPVAYVDVTDAWRLPRWQRVVVDIGGLYFQLIFDIFLYGMYLYSREPLLIFTIVAINASFIPNLNPMFKFDGYWALSDAIGVANLHKRVGDLWKQYLPLPGKKPPSAFLQTQSFARIVMWIYALAVTAYFAYFGWMLVWLAPKIIITYPGLLLATLTQVGQNLSMGNITAALSSIFQVLFPTVLLVGLGLLAHRFLLALWRVGKGGASLVHNWWHDRRLGAG